MVRTQVVIECAASYEHVRVSDKRAVEFMGKIFRTLALSFRARQEIKSLISHYHIVRPKPWE